MRRTMMIVTSLLGFMISPAPAGLALAKNARHFADAELAQVQTDPVTERITRAQFNNIEEEIV